MTFDPLLIVYAAPLAALWGTWVYVSKRRSRRAADLLEDNRKAGLMEPNTLHPVIDPSRCLGCAACVRACPEKTVLGIIDGKAALVEPTLCVGHGACQTACPTDAISLVFGTETRGVDIPVLTPDFETTVPGIFIAGELGGMGLIKNAIEQGRQAMKAAAKRARQQPSQSGKLDVVIVGCGPAGIAAGLGAMESKLDFRLLDQSTLGGTVAHFPRGKLVMTAPAHLPLVGEVKFAEVQKETLLAFWQGVLDKTGLAPNFEEQVTAILPEAGGFLVTTSKAEYRCKCVLLAIGRRGTPRPLGVPGEELEKVVYRLVDPDQSAGKRVLVVGGGDSALEAAIQLASETDAEVCLSYRGGAFNRARRKNREKIAALTQSGAVRQMLGSEVMQITADHVTLTAGGEQIDLPNDFVVVCAGGILPTQFLRDAGIAVDTRFGTA